ncbi:glutamate-cysteine ligase [Firmicutes bacterium M10-2]|nr:glutamate-cysteine ligase [Firmicutes bacterium M10-2]
MMPLVEYFKKGAKKDSRALGVEIEHFVLDKKTGHPMPYDEISKLLMSLRPFYDEAYFEEGHVIALESDTTLLTLEPGCQLELSFRYTDDLEQIKLWYGEAMKPILKYLDDHGYEIVYSGGLPTVSVDEVERIMKKRYELMEKWFKKSGERGHEMMKGTAAVHVSIDYTDEADFVRKYAMANYLHLLFSFLTSNTLYYEGTKNKDVFLRDSIWEHTDPQRTGYMPKALSPEMSFEAYADWVENVPLIVIRDGEQMTSANNKTCKEVAEQYGWSDEMIAHYLSMVFPFVRVKQFIEIRSADCMPLEWVIAYCALIKGLFYNQGNVRYYTDKAKDCTIDQLHTYKTQIEEKQWDAPVYGSVLQDVLREMIARAKQGLCPQEQEYLMKFERLVNMRHHIFEESK